MAQITLAFSTETGRMTSNMTKQTRVRHSTQWIGTAILLLAAILRLAAFDEALVGADQSSILSTAAEVAAFRSLPLVGIKSSIGVMQSAVTGYLAALPLLLMHKVIAIKWFFSILDLLALALLFRAVKQSFGPRAAAVAALLYATNPWVIEFNRWIWYQTLIPTFATSAFAAFLSMLSNDEKHPQMMLCVGLSSTTLMGLVHLAAVPWAAVLGLLSVGLAWRHRAWRGLAVGIALSTLVASPYLRYQLKSNFADVNMMLHNSGIQNASWNWATYRLSWELLTGARVLQTPRDPLWAASVWQLPGLYHIISVTLICAAGHAVARLIQRGPYYRQWGFTLGWAVLAPTLFVRSHIHLQHFYLLFLLPAPYVLIGAWIQAWTLLQHTRHNIRRMLARVATGLLLLLTLWWTHIWITRIYYEARGKLRAPTRAWLMDLTIDKVQHYLHSNPEGHIIVLNSFDGGDLSPFDWLRNFVHNDRVRVVPTGQGLIIPPGPTCYLLAPGASLQDLAIIATHITENPSLTVPATPSWPAYCTSSRPPLPSPLAEWQNGMQLLDVNINGDFAPGTVLNLTHTWHYEARAPKEYHIFNHLIQEDTLVAQVDGAGVPTWYWRDDDVLVTHFVLPIPNSLVAGTYRLFVGTYTWPEVERVFLDNGEHAYEITNWRFEDK